MQMADPGRVPLATGKERAGTAKDYLIAPALSAGRLSAVGFGSAGPVIWGAIALADRTGLVSDCAFSVE